MSRIQTPGLIHHVMARGNGRMAIFLDDADYRKFLYVLSDVVDTFAVECWNYCVMPNHYHLTLRNVKPNLSEAMRHLNSVYAQWWNDKHERVGYVFQGRFKDQVVQREGYLVNLCRYVALNPVRASLVQDPAAWVWSSYCATAGRCPEPAFLSVDAALQCFGGDDRESARDRFVRLVTEGDQTAEWWVDRIRSGDRILGDKTYKMLLEPLRAGVDAAALQAGNSFTMGSAGADSEIP